MDRRDDIIETQVRAAYDEKADTYAKLYDGDSRTSLFLQQRLRCVSELVAGSQGKRALDVGCGPAVLTNHLVHQGTEYYGVDISDQMIRRCKQRYERVDNAHFSVGNIRQLDFPNGFFDLILCLGVLEYVPDRRQAIREIARVLKTDGRLLISGNNKWSPPSVLDQLVGGGRSRQGKRTIVTEYHSEEDYRQLLHEQPFAVGRTCYFDFSLLPFSIAERIPWLVRFLNDRLDGLRRSPWRWLGNGFVLEASKVGSIPSETDDDHVDIRRRRAAVL